ncbi:Hypothetical predicted protein [Olea europaea subsp. europaea]|uniref:Uncharacterized protein n=1 Tax=Olea europaea subsp. europaea TaxID=158383 RepID=A0A8S0P971_OLEEU|nr:Hypothetical predicted protein [Olea europaea subsp. europaea]
MKEFLFTIFDIGPLFLQWCTIVEHGTATRNMIAHISTTAALFPPPSHHHSLLYPFHYCRQPYKSNTGATTQRIKIPTPTKVVDFVANVVREEDEQDSDCGKQAAARNQQNTELGIDCVGLNSIKDCAG